jgi:hypothetical protein
MSKCYECGKELKDKSEEYHCDEGWRTITDKWTFDDVFCKDCHDDAEDWNDSDDGRYGVGFGPGGCPRYE